MGSAWYSTVIMVNGLCHTVGYRIWDNGDTSTNLFPIDLLGWGEALHHNHHERQSRANLGHAKWEFDSGFWALWMLSKVGIVRNLRP
jgi:stearoyl-CoA desaturase (delta-9 desaturase)